MFCIECGQELNSDSEFCFKCGAKATKDESGDFCIQCGKKLPTDATFCIDCGAKASTEDESTSEGNVFCTQCGQKLSEDSEFCFSCGVKTAVGADEAETEQPEDIPQDVAEVHPIMDVAIEARQPSPMQATSDVAPALNMDITRDAPPKLTPPQELPPTPSADILESLNTKKQRGLVAVLFGVAIVLLIAVIGLVVFIILGRGTPDDSMDTHTNGMHHAGEQQTTIEDFDEAGDYYIHRVTVGQLDEHPGVAIGVALDELLVNPAWTHFHADDIEYVSVHGYLLREGETVMAQFVFQFTADGARFTPIMMSFDGYWQDIMLMHEILGEITAR